MADDALIEAMAEAIYGGDWDSLPEEAWLPNHGSLQDGKEQYRFMAKSALASIRKTHAVVPREPTDAMVEAGESWARLARATYRAMLNASEDSAHG